MDSEPQTPDVELQTGTEAQSPEEAQRKRNIEIAKALLDLGIGRELRLVNNGKDVKGGAGEIVGRGVVLFCGTDGPVERYFDQQPNPIPNRDHTIEIPIGPESGAVVWAKVDLTRLVVIDPDTGEIFSIHTSGRVKHEDGMYTGSDTNITQFEKTFGQNPYQVRRLDIMTGGQLPQSLRQYFLSQTGPGGSIHGITSVGGDSEGSPLHDAVEAANHIIKGFNMPGRSNLPQAPLIPDSSETSVA